MTRIDVGSIPRLARGVRLRRDRISGKLFLLRPEAGFELHGSAGEIVKLCQADRTVAEIADLLAEAHGDTPRGLLVEDTVHLLEDLARRGLVDVEDRP